MRVVLADLKSDRGFVSKDTVVGGYGSRLDPFSRVTTVMAFLKKRFHDVPSVHMAYMAAILARAGHEVRWTRGEFVDGDVALVLSSLVDHKAEAAWADAMRARGVKVGFVGITASKMPQLYTDHCDFILNGEPEAAVMAMAQSGEIPSGATLSPQIDDLDSLPFPRWDLVTEDRNHAMRLWFTRPVGGGYPLLASRGCPEFCTYCPHRILAGYRARSIANIVDEMERLCDQVKRPYVIFRDPLFTEQRERVVELCDEIKRRGLELTFEAETRLDRLDVETAAFYVLGFLQDDWNSIAATVDYSIDLGSTFAQFKMLTPYPGTPMFKQIEPLLVESDWEKYDGFTPTFKHPNLSERELRFLLGAAYKRFYMRPSYLANFLKIQNSAIRQWVSRMDQRVNDRHSREEIADISRPVAC